MPCTRRSATSSPPSFRRRQTSRYRRPSRAGQKQAGAQRIHHHAFQHDLRTRHDQRRSERKSCRRRIRRHLQRRGRKLRASRQRDAPPMLADVLDREPVRAEMRQHFLGVIASRFLLDHDRFAGRGKSGKQHRGFQLGRGHRRSIFDRDRIAGALQRHRQPPAIGGLKRAWRRSGAADRARVSSDACAARHRRRTSAVTGQPATAPMTRRQPVPELPKSSGSARLRETCDPHPPHRPGALTGSLDRGAECAHHFGGIDHVLAFEQARDPGLADGHRRQDQRAMRNRLVARHAQTPLQSGRAARGQRHGGQRMAQGGESGGEEGAVLASGAFPPSSDLRTRKRTKTPIIGIDSGRPSRQFSRSFEKSLRGNLRTWQSQSSVPSASVPLRAASFTT